MFFNVKRLIKLAFFYRETFTLTTGVDTFTGTAGNDKFEANISTFQSIDKINGGSGTDTLELYNNGTANWTVPAADVSAVEVVSVRDVSSTSATTGSAEVATITVGALKAGQYITVAGQTVLATADLTEAQVASALSGTTVTGATLSGTLTTGWTKAAGTNADTVTYTATSTGDKADLTVTGNAISNVPSAQIISFGGTAENAETHTLKVNGATVSYTTDTSGTLAEIATGMAAAINGSLGKTVAYAVGTDIQIVSTSTITISDFTESSATQAVTEAVSLAPSKQTITVTAGTTNSTDTVTFTINGTAITTAQVGTASDVTAVAVAIVNSINSYYGATIASNIAGVVTVDSGKVGLAISQPAATGATIGAPSTVTTSSGLITTDAPVMSVVNGVAAVAAATYTTTVDASKFVGIETVNANLSSGTVTVTNLGTADSMTITGNGALTNGAVNFGYQTAADAATLNLKSGVTSGAVAVTTAAATATVNSSGATNKITSLALGNSATALTINADEKVTTGNITGFTGTSAKITITGDSDAVIGTLENATVKTVDAGTSTGGVTATLNTQITAFTGGSGNDVVTTAATVATGAVIAAGAGTDKLVLANGTVVDTTAEGAQFTGFETLSVSNNQDMSLIAGITAVEVTDGSNTLTKMTATQAANVTQTATAASNSYALADSTGSADVLSLTLKSSTATTNVSATGLTVNGFETLNVNASTGTAGTDSSVTFTAADKLTSINVTGSADYAIYGTNTSKAVTVNGTAATGAATITGNFKDTYVVNTGAGKDEITLGTGFGSVNTGAGDDKISATVAQLNTAASYNVINAGEGTDTLTISDGATNAITIVDNNLSKITGVEKIVITDTTSGAQSITTGGFFNTAFQASGVDLTTASTTANITIDMTSFTGVAKLDVTTVATGAGGTIDVKTGSANDDVTVSAAAAGTAGAVVTYAGDDKITTANTEDFSLTGGAGNDTYVLGSSGANTVVFSSIATNGVDIIESFNAGTDKLTVSGLATLVGSASGGVDTDVVASSAAKADTAASEIAQISDNALADWSDVVAVIGTAATVAGDTTAGNANTLFLIDNGTDTRIYLFQDDATNNTTIEASELTLVATLVGITDATNGGVALAATFA